VAKGSLRGILAIVRIAVVQLTLLFWVDTFAAIARRRPLAASAGRRMRILLVSLVRPTPSWPG